MVRLDKYEQAEELLFYIGTILKMLFVFEPIDYDLERMLLMSPHIDEVPDYTRSDQNRFTLQQNSITNGALDDAQ